MVVKKWPGPSYVARLTFNAPSKFVYEWCTDYTPQDAKLEGGKYSRKIVERSARQVIYEDLEESKDGGWFWSHHVVRLSPPNHWHSESFGSHREYSLDYKLSTLSGDRTQLVLTARRRPTSIGGKNPKAGPWARRVERDWGKFRRVLERDLKRIRRGRR